MTLRIVPSYLFLLVTYCNCDWISASHVIQSCSTPYEELHMYVAKGRNVGYTLVLLLIMLDVIVVITVNKMDVPYSQS